MNETDIQGVITQEAEFAFRPTAGSLDVAEQANSDQALIKGVQGRTVSWNQLMYVLNISNTYKGVTITSNGDGTYTFNGTPTAQFDNSIPRWSRLQVIKGHVYYKKLVSENSNIRIVVTNSGDIGPITSLAGIAKCPTSGLPYFAFRVTLGVTFENQVVFPLLIDLTLIYGEGNEPSTAEEFEQDYFNWFGKPLTYEEYTAGELRNLNMVGVKTQGFNLLGSNGKSLLIGGTQYQLTGTYTGIADSQGTAITPDAQGLFTPEETTEVTVSGVGSDTCLHFVHSGRRNGEYEEHWEETQYLDLTKVKGKLDGTGSSTLVCPQGLLQAGDVSDEIYIQDGKRWFAKRVERRAYQSGDAQSSTMTTDGVSYTNEALATPEYYLLDDEWQDDAVWSYKADDWGTEEVVSPESGQSAPFAGTLRYGSTEAKCHLVEFMDRKERPVKVEITNTSLRFGYTKSLTPAAQPVSITEDDDRDPMLPIRATVVRIRVVCGYEDIIPVQNNLQWQVSISRSAQQIWLGYLRTDLPDARLADVSSEVFYVADDILGALKSMHKVLPNARASFYDLLALTYEFLDNSIPWLVGYENPDATLRALYSEPYNWMEEEDDVNGIQHLVPAMADAVERDILQFMGVCARYWNGHLYMGSLFGTAWQQGTMPLLLDPIDGSTFTWTGFHTIKTEEGIGQIAVQAQGREVSGNQAPRFGDDIWGVAGIPTYLPPQEDFVEGGDRNCFVRNLYPLPNSGLQTFEYADRLYVAGNFLGTWGAHMVDYDQWADNGEPKPNFTFTRSLFVVGQSLDVDYGTELPIETFTSGSGFSTRELALKDAVRVLQARRESLRPFVTVRIPSVVANGGGLTYSFEEVESDIRNGRDASTGLWYRYIYKVAGNRDLTHFVFTLRFGNQYWQGGGWGTEPLLLYQGYHKLLPKDFRNDFTGDGTYSAPINGLQTGDVELTLYGIWEPDYTHTVVSEGVYTWQCVMKPRSAAILSGINLQYNPPLNLLDVGYKSAYTLSKRTAGFPDKNEKTVELKLLSAADVKDSWGWVYDSGGNKINTLYWQGVKEDKPERIVLDRNVAALSCNRQYATMSVECEYEHMPFRRVEFMGRTWYPLAVKTDLRTCFSEVLMFDITDIHL